MKNRLLLPLSLLTLAYTTYCQGIDLKKVYELAKENDSEVAQMRERLNATRENKPQAQARLRPFVSIGADAQLMDVHLRRSNFGPTEDSFLQKELALRLSYPLYHKDYWIQLEQTEDAIAQGEVQLTGAEINLMVRTTRAYFDILAAADDMRTASAEKTAHAQQLEQAQQRFNVGLIAVTDVHESQAAYDSALAQELIADNALSNAWEALREIVGELHQPIAKLGESLTLLPPQPDNVEKWAETALQNNHSIQAAQKAVNVARKNVAKQHAGYFPTVDIIGSYGIADSGSDFGSNRDVGMIGLQFTMPLYQGGAVGSRERQAVHEYKAAQEALDQQRKATNRLVRDAFRGVLSTTSRIKALQSAVVSAEAAVKSTQAGFEVGTRTMVDVLTITKGLYQAQRNYARARYDYIINGLLLQQAAGTLTPETMIRINSWLTPKETQAPPP